MAASTAHGAIDAVWRIESARLIAGLTRIVRDVSVAEDLAQDALVAALEQWPRDGGVEIELRHIIEADDFGEELTPELREREARLREQTAGHE